MKIMKSILKKLVITVCAMSVTLTVAATAVLATREAPRSGPNDNTSVTDTVRDNDNSDREVTAGKDTATESDNVTTQAENKTVSSKKYLTKWGGFWWFLLSVIVNFVVCCWVSNRFYRLAKRNTQGSAEIRALRKDIEEKFASTLVDINEPTTEVVNRNENYAMHDEGMEMPERRQSVEINEEEREILGRWDMKRTAERESNTASEDTYEMRRPMARIQFEDEMDESEEILESKTSKTKNILNNIFSAED